MKLLVVIPARGGSRGIPQKNIRMLDGKPLISYSISCASHSKYNPTVVVSSENNKILFVAQKYGATPILRPSELSGDEVTLDPVINDAVDQSENIWGSFDVVITMQPTSPTLKTATLDSAIDYFIANSLDTLISGVKDPRLSWKDSANGIRPNYLERKNRQYLPNEYKETGAFVITRRCYVTSTSRFGENIDIFQVPKSEAIDIDDASDWYVAERELCKKKILIRVEGHKKIGLGHIYRCLQIADSLIDHEICFAISNYSDLGIKKLEDSRYKYVVLEDETQINSLIQQWRPNIIINDILNTSEEYIKSLKKYARVINFEDLGDGSIYADATINDLYTQSPSNNSAANTFWGSSYYIIRDEFLLAEQPHFNDKVKEILVVFGGTDPGNLTEKTLRALLMANLPSDSHVTIILGLGYEDFSKIEKMTVDTNICVCQNVASISSYMEKADLAISSQGRTMLELASLGVPTILMAQNPREKTHEFGSIHNGFLNLGLGQEVDVLTLAMTVDWLIQCPQIRKNMHDEMLKTDLKSGMKRVRKIILNEE